MAIISIKKCLGLSILMCAFVNSEPLMIKDRQNCQELSATIKNDNLQIFNNNIEVLRDLYALSGKFSAGKGGAYVALVVDKMSGEKKVLKIFPTIANENNKYRSENVLYQIVHLLYELKRLKINGKEYGFVHADLNPGNVLIRYTNFSGTIDAGFGKIQVSNIPLVTFVDFGHSTSNFDDDLGNKVKSIKIFYHKTLHIFSGSMEKFYQNLNGSSLGKLARLSIALSGTNSDIRLYRFIARALFDSGNYLNKSLIKHLNDCTTRIKCVEKTPTLIGPLP